MKSGEKSDGGQLGLLFFNLYCKGRKMSLLDQKVAELKVAGINLTQEQEKVLREAMLDLAFCACIDSSIRKEVEEELTGYTEDQNDPA